MFYSITNSMNNVLYLVAQRYLVTLWHVGTWVRSRQTEFFSLKKQKNKIKMPNGRRTIKSLVHKIRLHGRRGKGMAESFSRQKLRHAPQKEGGWEILCDLPPVWPRLVRPTNLMSRMNGKKTHTHTHLVALLIVWIIFYSIINSMNNSWKHESGSKQKWTVGCFKEKSANNASKTPEHPPNGMQSQTGV